MTHSSCQMLNIVPHYLQSNFVVIKSSCLGRFSVISQSFANHHANLSSLAHLWMECLVLRPSALCQIVVFIMVVIRPPMSWFLCFSYYSPACLLSIPTQICAIYMCSHIPTALRNLKDTSSVPYLNPTATSYINKKKSYQKYTRLPIFHFIGILACLLIAPLNLLQRRTWTDYNCYKILTNHLGCFQLPPPVWQNL